MSDQQLATEDEEKRLRVQTKIEKLKEELEMAKEELELLGGHDNLIPSIALSLEKRGYLYKWNDRSIGWSGSKWGLRYVVLDHGRISYYGNHKENIPRYEILLNGLAVRDDGWKRNRRHLSKKGGDPPLDEPGAYFFVFSIYERRNGDDNEVLEDQSEEIIPLLRFSTPSLAEKKQWIQLISQSCAYCETDAFLEDEVVRQAELLKQQEEEKKMMSLYPGSRDETLKKKETLPALYFAPAVPVPVPNPINKRMPSVSSIAQKLGENRHTPAPAKMHRSESFQTKTNNSDLDKVEAKSKRSYPASKPMHREAASSLLSPDAKSQNYAGFLNLGILILVVSNFRLLLDTINNHGFVLPFSLPSLSEASEDPWHQVPVVVAAVVQLGFVSMSFAIEWMLSRGQVDEYLGVQLHYLNAHTTLALPTYVVWKMIDNPVAGITLLFHAVITWMKLISYLQANEDYRAVGKEKRDDQSYALGRLVEDLDPVEAHLTYPQNVTLRNILYFWVAPTLTYQIAFPKTDRVRWWKVLLILGRMAVVFLLGSYLIAQVVNPVLSGLLQDLEAAQGQRTAQIFLKYWLKLSITSTYLWLLIFYGYFHLFLNLTAELLRFGDRVFYRDWWNSATASAFWRLWNMPVHYWLVRHVFFPCIRMKMSKTMASLVVFSLSAIMHEVLVSVPFHIIRPWSFLGMIFQVPLVGLTKYIYRAFPGSSMGNFIFWISFCLVGQPMAVLLYTIDYQYQKRVLEGSPM